LFPPYRAHFDARALSPVRATQFDGACLRDKCAADPAFGFDLMSRFAQVLIERLQWTRLRLLDIYGDGR
jgi:CRP-like cAMP-binding protein